ncbi:hypothetical protein [Deinococcus sp. Leaf326]|uniref:hypothetical protein n=1 Tax=Deinococcus sp. Leaf326 TaxID=1736338 RepID=UPI0006FD6F78|nr:hypothetical protein [Deinococcus sp. Leaf326]KQR15701.1 hypothetical protein ASF71_08745 [Deinococcus sp. Leaf326]
MWRGRSYPAGPSLTFTVRCRSSTDETALARLAELAFTGKLPSIPWNPAQAQPFQADLAMGHGHAETPESE